jgi:hypothetical protein
MVDAVIEPDESTTNAPLATDMVPVVLIEMLDARSLPVIEPSVIEELETEFVPTVDVIPVNPEPSPENPVAVTVPITWSFVCGVSVPMPIFKPLVARNISDWTGL